MKIRSTGTITDAVLFSLLWAFLIIVSCGFLGLIYPKALCDYIAKNSEVVKE